MSSNEHPPRSEMAYLVIGYALLCLLAVALGIFIATGLGAN